MPGILERMRYTIHADGGSRGNPGNAGAGAVVKDETGQVVASVSEFLGHATNNVAEYTAILRGLEALRDVLGPEASHEADVSVFMDSMLVVKQMSGEWKLKHPGLKPLAFQVREAMSPFRSVSFGHVYREFNTEADKLANDAMDRGA